MKKLLLTALTLCALGSPVTAKTILSEDFENGKTTSDYDRVAVGDGWTTVNGYTGSERKYNWFNYYYKPDDKGTPTMFGTNCAACDATIFGNGAEGGGPREELLITPELDLDGTYQLQFSFKVSPMNAYDNSRYDLQVRVITDDNVDNAETIFSIQNEKMLRDAGITIYPIPDWSIYTPKIDLTDFKGEKVKLAFVFKMFNEIGNIVYLDEISVSEFAAPTGPQPQLSMDRYNFGKLYVGQKRYSDIMTLTNTGKDGLTITSIDYPNGVSINGFDPSTLSLDRYQTVQFQLAYDASVSSAASGQVVMHTNGGDAVINVTAEKEFVPEGMTLETFEGFFPPAGWTNNGWGSTANAIEGDQSAVGSGDFSKTTFQSPRLDLTDGGNVTFTYYNSFFDEVENSPYYDITLEVSTDGGNTWKQKWTSADGPLNEMATATVKLGYGDDNSYIRWVYPAVETDDEVGALPHSTFFLDGVLLPAVYGADGVPTSPKITTPENGAENIYTRDIKLAWEPAQFANGYKIYLGTTSAANETIDGLDVGNVLEYTIAQCDYETEYIWKVVGYNDQGDGRAATGHFKTQPDASVSQYPYEEHFTAEGLPQGWNSTPSNDQYGRVWEKNGIQNYVYDGDTYGVLYTPWLLAGSSNSVNTQEFLLPADSPMAVEFTWGDNHPASLMTDPDGSVKKDNVEPNNGISECIFEVGVDGEWIKLSSISEPKDHDYNYWITEKFDLTPYMGKKVTFRWSHNSFSGRDSGAGLTRVRLYANETQKGEFNCKEWNAGKVNYEKAATSGEVISVINRGSEAMTVKSVEFGTNNFTSTINAGDVVPAEGNYMFGIRFDALRTAETNEPVTVEDEMTINFESGYSMKLPVSGVALPEGTYYYSFEPNELDYQWDEDMTMIDADNAPGFTFGSWWIHYSMDGMRSAFSAENDLKTDIDNKAQGMYGMMKPVSGIWALVASSPQTTNADNWIISKKMLATSVSSFDFYARNWETINSVLPSAKHHVTVLVSTDGNTKTSDFKNVVMRDTEMDYLDEGEWHHFEVDLSEYEGQEIYVALRHTTNAITNLAFFDDFCFRGFDGVNDNGVDGIAADAYVTVYSLDGTMVANGEKSETLRALAKGVYIVKATTAAGSSTYKIVK